MRRIVVVLPGARRRGAARSAPRFAQHNEIVVWVGPTGTTLTVPATYAFPAGL